MALLSGTAAEFALNLLRSGKAFEPSGIKLFKSGYRATQGATAPEELVSEFQRLVKSLEVEAIQNRLRTMRLRKNKVRDASGNVPWSSLRNTPPYIPKSVDFWTNLYNIDQSTVKKYLDNAENLDAFGSSPHGAAKYRNEAAIADSLYKLFGSRQA